jgi:hypothetical protein
MDRELFESVQAKLQSNAHTRKLALRTSPYLLTGLLYDSAGNRMSPSHTLKKGVRYRYYVSQGLLQSRDVSTLGEVNRISAPDLEEVVTVFLHQRIKIAGAVPEALRNHVERITVRADRLEFRFLDKDTAKAPDSSDAISMPWRAKATRLEKGIVHNPVHGSSEETRAREALLKAIAKSRGWLKELTEGTKLPDIARRADRSERQIRVLLNLAFLPPGRVQALIEGTGPVDTITNVARQVPLLWPEMLERLGGGVSNNVC